MNKLTFALLLVAVCASAALARTSPQIRRPFKFIAGQTYQYEYRGRQWNGLVSLADQYAGLNLDCQVIMSVHPNSNEQQQEILMKLTNVNVDQLHTQTLANNEIRSLNAGQEKNLRQLTMFREELTKPIKITYVDGKVLRFVAEANDAEWSINMKKSILSLFQLDLAPTKIIKSPSKLIREQQQQGVATTEEQLRQVNQELPMVYPIYEESFGGICETLYELDSNENTEGRQQQDWTEQQQLFFGSALNVTKTVNYKNCLTDPSVSYDRHSFQVKSQTIKGHLFANTVFENQFNGIPEELKQKYANVYTSSNNANNVASKQPVERYSFTKYNMTTRPLISQQQDALVIEQVYSEGKIKYQADGDQLISETQQSLKLKAIFSTEQLKTIQDEEIRRNVMTELRSPIIPYETIQCELNAQKLRFYQAVWKYNQAKQQLATGQQANLQNALYSHETMLPFALSASWYPLVATDVESTSLLESLNPNELAKSFENLLVSLAEDVISEDVVESKKAGEKVVRMLNVIAFMPKYKLQEIYANILGHLKQVKLEQVKSARAAGKSQEQVDDQEVSKWRVVRKLYLDILPLAGSKQAIEMIEQLIEQQQVRSWESKELCEAVPANLHYPDTEIIDAFIRISQLPQIRKSRATFASCSIAVGKMINQAWTKSKDASFKPTTYESADHLPSQLRSDDLVRQVVEEADPRRQLPVSWNKSPEQVEQLYSRLVLDEKDLVKYVKLYKQLLSKASQYHEKVIYIETLAHMKVTHVLSILEPYITGRLSLAQCLGQQPLDLTVDQSQYYQSQQTAGSRKQQQFTADNKDWSQDQAQLAEECNYMRTIAIYSLAHVSRVAPAEIQAMLLPVFSNTFEPYQLRIAAFTSIMTAPVDEHILERIASEMWREPSKEVASFVVGCIDTFSKFMSPQLQAYKWAALKAADSMPKQYLDTWKFSSLTGGDHFNHKRQAGLSWLAEIVKSNVSSIPRGAYFHVGRFSGPAGSNYDNIWEFGFTSKGLETFMKQYVAYNKEQQQQQQQQDETNIIASIFENLYDTKDDLVKFYREARDEIKSSAQSTVLGSQTAEWAQRERLAKKQGKSQEEWEKESTMFAKRQQPIEGVNSQLGKQERKLGQLFEGQYSQQQQQQTFRNKRSVTFQAHASQDDHEQAKMTIFSKFFEQTGYHALDKREMVKLMDSIDDYVKMTAEDLVLGGKLHYVKLMLKSNKWHMVPSQLGLPVVVTHRTPIIVSLKIDASNNGQQTSTKASQFIRQQVTGSQQIPNVLGQNFATKQAMNITALVHPKIMVSNVRFLFAVEQAQSEAYGVQTEKSHQFSLPMECSIAYSADKQLVSFAMQPKTPARVSWTKEVARTFIGPVTLSAAHVDSNWLGREHMIRTASKGLNYNKHEQRSNQVTVPSIWGGLSELISKSNKLEQQKLIEDLETPYNFQQKFNPSEELALEIQIEGATDDENVVEAIQKPTLSEQESQWSSTDDVDDMSQHVSSGPVKDLLHIVDFACNRPTKYAEFYTTIKADEQQSPIYRFNFVLNGNDNKNQQQQQQTQTINQQEQLYQRRPLQTGTRLDMQKIQREIEDAKQFQKQSQQQLPIALEVY